MPARPSPAILLVAYGSCAKEGIKGLRDFESLVRQTFPGVPIRWAYTSERIRTRLACQIRHKSDSVPKALRRLALEHFTHVAVQPLQVVPASENAEVEEEVRSITLETGMQIETGPPLLSEEGDIEACASAAMRHLPRERTDHEDVLVMGHGTRHCGQHSYALLAERLAQKDPKVRLATMSGDMTLDDALPALESKRIWLLPLLATVGKHALLDMAGAEPDSWKSRIEASGHTCIPVVSGMIEKEGFASIWLEHLKQAFSRLDFGGERKAWLASV